MRKHFPGFTVQTLEDTVVLIGEDTQASQQPPEVEVPVECLDGLVAALRKAKDELLRAKPEEAR